ncbi:MAG: hypothetical protein L0H19_02935 [Salinisphaera sp.]|nr:hypothetical protein [Salinisphaera sp.]MDN5938751.1 hypothetical protein [Salinisphaera sp.]
MRNLILISALFVFALAAGCSQNDNAATNATNSDTSSTTSSDPGSTSLSIDTEDGTLSYENKGGGDSTSLSIDTEE